MRRAGEWGKGKTDKREERHEKKRVKDGKGSRRAKRGRIGIGDNGEREWALGRAKGAREEKKVLLEEGDERRK